VAPADANRDRDGVTVTYTYDASGNRNHGVGRHVHDHRDYDRLNGLSPSTTRSGTAADTTYTTRLTSRSWTDPTGAMPRRSTSSPPNSSMIGDATDFSWTYRADGLPRPRVPPTNTTTFAYDGSVRLTQGHAAGCTNGALTTDLQRGQVLSEPNDHRRSRLTAT